MKIPLYIFKPLEELARAVLVAVVAYALTAIYIGGIPDGSEAWRALATGALPIAIAAVRASLNKTPLTPDGEVVQLPPPATKDAFGTITGTPAAPRGNAIGDVTGPPPSPGGGP